MADVAPDVKTETVRVVIRCRPLSKTETSNGNKMVVDMNRDKGQVVVHNPAAGGQEIPKSFTYDSVYPPGSAQELIFDDCAHGIVVSVLQGYNGTIFAYGQTGTGKTFTMEGENNPPELAGVTPRTFKQIFDHIEASSATHLVRASFLEIYQDQVLDLLKGPKRDGKRDALELKEHPDTGVYVKDLETPVVQTASALQQILDLGKSHRATGQTLMNDRSSRSHCVFTITVETQEKGPDGQDHIRVGKLNLVDLAGSERQTKTGASGQRLKEAAKINLALSALGNVISSLTKKGGAAGHIPYRDSKLTRILQDSLGGNTKTVMIANIGPADYNYDETISTLRFATRAKTIQNKPRVNEDPKDTMLRQFQEEIERLTALLESENGDGPVMGPNGEMIPGPGGLPRLGAGKIVVEKVVEKVIQMGITEDQLEEAKRRAEADKREAEANALAEIEESRAVKRRVQEQSEVLQKTSERTTAMVLQSQQNKQALKAKLKEVEAQLLRGDELMGEAKRQEQILEQRRQELKRRNLEMERQKRLKAQKEAENFKVAQSYESQQEELQDVNRKLEMLREQYNQVRMEMEDVQAQQQQQREDMLDTIRGLTRHIQLKDTILQHFVPYAERDKVEARARWNDADQDWYLEQMDLMAQNVKVDRPRSAIPGQRRPVSEFARKQVEAGAVFYRERNILDLQLHHAGRTTQDMPGVGQDGDQLQDDRGRDAGREYDEEVYEDEYGYGRY